MHADQRLCRCLRPTTLALATLSILATGFATADPVQTHWITLAVSGGIASLCWILGGLAEQPSDKASRMPGWIFWLLAGLFAVPAMEEPLRRTMMSEGRPAEIVLLLGLRNLTAGLACLMARPPCIFLAAVASLFLVIFAMALSQADSVLCLTGAYLVTAIVWLMHFHWSRLRHCRHANAEESLRLPVAGVFAVVGVLTAVCGLIGLGHDGTGSVLAELASTSGGTGWKDDFARGGVNDGDDVVKGRENAQSYGYVDSDIYLDSKEPSLYDVFNEMYGEPTKPRDFQRAVAVATDRIRETENPTRSYDGRREFPMSRNRKAETRKASDHRADALLYALGSAPAHLRLKAFNVYTGHSWTEAPEDRNSHDFVKGWRSWWRVVAEKLPYFAGKTQHRLKIGKLSTSEIPTPPQLTRFRIPEIDRKGFFRWGQEGIVRLDDGKLRVGTVVDVESRTLWRSRLSEIDFPASPLYALPVWIGRMDALESRRQLATLANEWTSNLPHGWEKVEAICARLRAEYALDAEATPESDVTDAIADFLFRRKRGPDYLFASAATLLLRELGIPARLATGLYLNPRHYDPRTGHTPAYKTDMHFWVEVLLPDGNWVVAEPTPGFECPPPSPSPMEWLFERLATIGAALCEHWLIALAIAAAGAGLWLWRRRWQEAIAELKWRAALRSNEQRAAIATLRLIEKRARWHGFVRSCGSTPRQWFANLPVAPGGAFSKDSLLRLADAVDQALYAGSLSPAESRTESIVAACRMAAAEWKAQRFKELADADRIRSRRGSARIGHPTVRTANAFAGLFGRNSRWFSIDQRINPIRTKGQSA